MDNFWDAILSVAGGAGGAGGASNTLQRNFKGGYSPIPVVHIQHNGVNAPLAPLTPPGADPYDTEERHAIQQEGNAISNLPDKPILSLAEQAALVLDGYNGDKEQAAADLRVVACNFALADYIEHGIKPAEPPASSLACNTTPMTPDRGFDDIAGFEGMPNLTPSEHGAILHRLTNPAPQSPAPAKSTTDAPAAPTMQPAPSMAPAIIDTQSCGRCAHFTPGPTRHGIGQCSITKSERVPKGGTGYAHAYETAPRVCNRFSAATQQPVRQSAPAAITCSSCAEFHPGKTPNGAGRCSRTADGSPPVASRAYGACFPTAPRFCSDYKEP